MFFKLPTCFFIFSKSIFLRNFQCFFLFIDYTRKTKGKWNNFSKIRILKFLFLVDNPQQIQVAKDTSFAFMESAQALGHKIYYLPRGGIFFQKEVLFSAFEIKVARTKKQFIAFGKQQVFTAKEVNAVFIRLEPPFNEDYLQHTWLLDLAKKDCFIINDPQGIRNANEKLWALRFPELLPKTVVARQKEVLWSFLQDQKHIIAKPIDGFGGSAIFKLRIKDSNAMVALEVLSHNFTREIMLQTYIEEAKLGDKRILLLNGEILGAVLRVQKKGEHRNNFFAGATATQAKITKKDQEIVSQLAPYLRQEGLYFTGIDILGESLIEVNVTSPTCIQEASFFTKKDLSASVINFIKNRV
jgi:glutathione synthase